MNENSTKKSQLIVFDAAGKIISSCNTLLMQAVWQAKIFFEVFPVLGCVKEIITRQEADSEPIFLPHIAFSTYKYRSICDFVFVKKKVKDGVVISWLINDNSMHYKSVLQPKTHTGRKTYGSYFMIEATGSYSKQRFIR
ncbi:MAG: hypothetical protein IPJ79_10545 [Bacteroidetes bacterium]|nr:hypothetical protein [Bacteroidota bacterium]